MRVAHFSDPHILDLDGVPASRLLFSKRATGWVNLKVLRNHTHRRSVVEAMMRDVRALGVDHVAVTGDVTNLSLEPEFDRARDVISALGLAPEQVSIVPGNHDVYTGGAQRSKRFASFFAKNITSDLRLADDGTHPAGPFPFVRLRDNVAIIGISTAVARPPLVSSGRVGEAQLRAIASALAHSEVRSRTPVLLMHHPLVNPGHVFTLLRGMIEAPQLRELIEAHERSVVLHGHLHHRVQRTLPSRRVPNGLRHIGATSASLVHESPHRMAGYNLYDIGSDGLESVRARVWDPSTESFTDGDVHARDTAA